MCPQNLKLTRIFFCCSSRVLQVFIICAYPRDAHVHDPTPETCKQPLTIEGAGWIVYIRRMSHTSGLLTQTSTRCARSHLEECPQIIPVRNVTCANSRKMVPQWPSSLRHVKCLSEYGFNARAIVEYGVTPSSGLGLRRLWGVWCDGFSPWLLLWYSNSGCVWRYLGNFPAYDWRYRHTLGI